MNKPKLNYLIDIEGQVILLSQLTKKIYLKLPKTIGGVTVALQYDLEKVELDRCVFIVDENDELRIFPLSAKENAVMLLNLFGSENIDRYSWYISNEDLNKFKVHIVDEILGVTTLPKEREIPNVDDMQEQAAIIN